MPKEPVWFCCDCGYGPNSLATHSSCGYCLHLTCQRCRYESLEIPTSCNDTQPHDIHSKASHLTTVLLSNEPTGSRSTDRNPSYTPRYDDGLSTPRGELSAPKSHNNLDPFDEFILWPDLDAEKNGGADVKSGMASHLATVLLSDVNLRRLMISGCKENLNLFNEHLNACLHLFANDLQLQATLEHEQEAAALIVRHASTIVREVQLRLKIPAICEGIDSGDEKAPAIQEVSGSGFSAGMSERETYQDKVSIGSDFTVVQHFVLGSTCFQSLLFRLEQYVEDLRAETEARFLHIEKDQNSLFKFFTQIFSQIRMLMEPKAPPETVRIRWRCSCGEMMWADYPERRLEDIALLESRLDWLFRSVPNGRSTTRSSVLPFNPYRPLQLVGASFRVLSRMVDAGHEPQRDPEDTPPSPQPYEMQQQANHYLLTCVDTGWGLPKLSQERWNAIRSDRAYFDMLRTLYKNRAACWRSWLTCQTITGIEYVRFHPTINGLASVCSEIPAFPPDSRFLEYMPSESLLKDDFLFEAWPSRTLLHLYNTSHDVDTYRRILNRIPRKLTGRLVTTGDEAEVGWGMYLRCGLHWEKFFWTCLTALMLCLVPGVTWWMVRDDIQGGTGITSCLMGFVGFFIAAATFNRH